MRQGKENDNGAYADDTFRPQRSHLGTDVLVIEYTQVLMLRATPMFSDL
jgi:hypothetical protein